MVIRPDFKLDIILPQLIDIEVDAPCDTIGHRQVPASVQPQYSSLCIKTAQDLYGVTEVRGVVLAAAVCYHQVHFDHF